MSGASIPHIEAVAGRPNIGIPVTDALVRCGHDSVLLALVRNATARISDRAFATLVEKSKALTGLQGALIHRSDLPPKLANNMCEWVSDALKDHIKANYTVAPANLEAALTDAKLAVKSEPTGSSDVPADSALKLVEKLAASGQLKAGFLMRVLSQGQIDLFDLAFAKLAEMELSAFRARFYEQGAYMVALACRAAGIDRSVFNTVYNLSRQSRGMSTVLSAMDTAAVDTVFTQKTRQAAMDELRKA